MAATSDGSRGCGAVEAGFATLDPADWTAFGRVAHRMLDAALAQLREVRERPVWTPVPAAVKACLAEPLPRAGAGIEQVAEDALRLILPYATGNTHPRFFGWVHGAGTAGGVLAELLAAAMNANLGGREHGAVYVERQVIEWCRTLFGFPEGASGLLVSGTSMATLIALTVARHHHGGGDLRASGLRAAPRQLVGYTSSEGHGSIARAFEILGLGRAHLRRVPVDAHWRIDLGALRHAIAADRQAGLQPFCVIGSAGTVNTGAIDDLEALADLCAEQRLWLHVDGAFGALAVLSDRLRPRLAGIERADSLAFDFHKWLHVPYDAGCVLVRQGELHRQTFAARADYLASESRGLAGGEPWFCDYGPELSRGFRALKVWFTLKEHGTEKLGAAIEMNCRQARHLAGLVERRPELELLAPTALNIVCFRLWRPGVPSDALDRWNAEVVADLQEQGIAAPSTTRLRGSLAIRVNLTNHRTRDADLDLLVEAVVRLGKDRWRRSRARPGAASWDATPLGAQGGGLR